MDALEAITVLAKALHHIRIDRVDDDVRVKLVCRYCMQETYAPNNVSDILTVLPKHLHV